ncbi:MAG: hypothetical protein HYX78_14105 [Armatimonadetes bacterium]|nr:hypothetical protein [Armatimonadota bacterium]
MRNKIIRNSEALLAFIFILRPNMSKPQMRHLVEITDAIITCEGEKTLSRLNRQLLEERDVYSVAVRVQT